MVVDAIHRARIHMNQAIMLGLRFLHIVSGVFWAGAVLLMVGFIFPAVRASGPQGGRFMEEVAKRRLPVFMNIASGLTMLSGLIMYIGAIAMTDGAWLDTRSGMGFTVGAVATIIAAAIGGTVSRRSQQRMADIGQAIKASGGAPTPEQAAELGAVQARMAKAMRVVAALLLIAVTSMATSRYL
jgi:hypothetical protein